MNAEEVAIYLADAVSVRHPTADWAIDPAKGLRGDLLARNGAVWLMLTLGAQARNTYVLVPKDEIDSGIWHKKAVEGRMDSIVRSFLVDCGGHAA